MTKKTLLTTFLMILLAMGLGASLSGTFWLYRKVRVYEARHGVSILSVQEVVPGRTEGKEKIAGVTNATVEVATPVSRPSETNRVVSTGLRVVGISYDGKTRLSVKLTEKPDMTAIRQYVRVEPPCEGDLGISCGTVYNPRTEMSEPCLNIIGEFAYRTNVVLSIVRGLPQFGKTDDPEGLGALAETYVHTFRRKDPVPSVDFSVESGRYLPPSAAPQIGVESANAASVVAEVRRVEARNVVQLLAREEDKYRSYFGCGGDSRDTIELSGQPTTVRMRCKNRLNEKENWRVPVRVEDGVVSNGVFLVSVRNGEKPFCPTSYRLVCVSDLGLSVRAGSGEKGSPKGCLGIWVTSLTRGTPIEGAWIEVYSQANVKVMEGRSDANGWCEPARVAKGEAFAVVVLSPEADDMTFMALSERMRVDETRPDGVRKDYLREGECEGFSWTERGIYRHDEKIFYHLILRDSRMKVPRPFPVELCLINPRGGVFVSKTVVSDERGAVSESGFSVPAEQPSGTWRIRAKLPGKGGRTLSERVLKVEEFTPPTIRVEVLPRTTAHPTNFSFEVSSAWLFGGAAKGLKCSGAVVFVDKPFRPEGWEGYTFGNDLRGVGPAFRRLGDVTLDENGKTHFAAPFLTGSGLPKARLGIMSQGVVMEDGGRPVAARSTVEVDYYPFYIGSRMSSWVRLPQTKQPTVSLVCVNPDGSRLKKARQLTVRVERVESIYSYVTSENGRSAWTQQDVRTTVVDDLRIETSPEGDVEVALPLRECGDYELTATDTETGTSFGRSFYLSDWGDDSIRAPLGKSKSVKIQADKSAYRVGETPRLVVKSPFAGVALVSVMREGALYSEVHHLTNATAEVVLRPVTRADAPNLEVAVSVVQGVDKSTHHLAARAHGRQTILVRPREEELSVSLSAEVEMCAGGGAHVSVDLETLEPCDGAAVVTIVDEGINMLTEEKRPDPTAWFARPRGSTLPLYDLYEMILPVLEDGVRANGVKTGGGSCAEMLNRVSSVATRRFKPLALWKENVRISSGKGRVEFTLPEFVGEVRITAVVYDQQATGSATLQKKVTPKVVMLPDAPRFVAPNDQFACVLPIFNKSDKAVTVDYSVGANGRNCLVGRTMLPSEGSTNVFVTVQAPDAPGEMELTFETIGAGESHRQTILLPVRPAVAWVESAGTCRESEWRKPVEGKWSARTFDSPIGEYEAALRWLADYPHGCLEQTASRIFPLVAASGILNVVVTNGMAFAQAGVRRVESMVRENDFVMWPDCDYAPWTREVSVYAAHFLMAAERAGVALAPNKREKVVEFLEKWSRDKSADVASYALMVLAEAGVPERGGMLRLFDNRNELTALARARLACAFSASGDRLRARALLAESYEPQSVKEAAFLVLARLSIEPSDSRILPLVTWLNAQRDHSRMCWGTTEENAHALLAIGSYFRVFPPKQGERFVSWRKLTLPALSSVRDESSGLFVSRRHLHPDGREADLGALHCGDLLMAEISITSAVTRVVNDLVIEDLFPGAFEPVLRELDADEGDCPDWIMRKDARDDRMLVFSKKFKLEAGHVAKVVYPVRVVSAGEYVLPGTSVEGMYDPRLHARRAPGRVVVCR